MNLARHRRTPAAVLTVFEYAGILLLAAPFFLLTVKNYLHLDLWFDEIQSLEDFILVPVKTTVTDYRFPNNHVFFSLVTNLALRSLGIRDLFRLMDEPWIVRSLMLVISTLALLAIYAVGKRHFGRRAGLFATVMLATTIPFYNFAVQVRGYVLSMLLLTLLVHLVWAMEVQPGLKLALAVASISALMMYTIPLNLYVLAAMMICQCGFAVAPIATRGSSADASDRGWRPHAAVAASLAAGVAGSVLLYLPILDHVLHNPYVEARVDFNPRILTHVLPEMMVHVLSGRWALLWIAAFGAAVLARQLWQGGNRVALRKSLLLGAAILLPFVCSFIRRDRPYDRVFVNLVPVAALFLALNVDQALRPADPHLKGGAALVSFAIVAYCLMRFGQEVQRKDRVLLEKINAPTHEKKAHNVYEAYFQARYQPNQIAHLTRDMQARSDRARPVFLGAELDKQAFPRHFLLKEGVAFTDVCRSEPRDYPDFSEALIISTHPRAFEAAIHTQLPGTLCLRVNPEPWFSNLYYCRKS